MSDRHGEDAVTVFCILRPKPDMGTRVREALVSLVEPTRNEPGCLSYVLHETDDGVIVLSETWRTPDDLAAHQARPAVRALFDDQLGDLLAQQLDAYFTRPVPAAASTSSPADHDTTDHQEATP